ncbi:hypothetical protein M0802_009883 [Mischocyttarus mexicanus]|nr:hypothetical protein M0802_009883 [Mischocyttarus mexicanus]
MRHLVTLAKEEKEEEEEEEEDRKVKLVGHFLALFFSYEFRATKKNTVQATSSRFRIQNTKTSKVKSFHGKRITSGTKSRIFDSSSKKTKTIVKKGLLKVSILDTLEFEEEINERNMMADAGVGGVGMLRARRRDVSVKPNRKLDRKSSRGMIYENEELRLRTIHINAEVEQALEAEEEEAAEEAEEEVEEEVEDVLALRKHVTSQEQN